MTPEEARITLDTPVARIIYRDYEDCPETYVDRVWDEQLEIPEFADTVNDFENTARKVLDYLLTEQRSTLLTALRGEQAEGSWRLGSFWVVPDE